MNTENYYQSLIERSERTRGVYAGDCEVIEELRNAVESLTDEIVQAKKDAEWWESSFEAAHEWCNDLKKALLQITITSDVNEIGRIAEAALRDEPSAYDGRKQVDVEKLFLDWWGDEGRLIDPDDQSVPWFDKRHLLAEYAFVAGYDAAKAPAVDECSEAAMDCLYCGAEPGEPHERCPETGVHNPAVDERDFDPLSELRGAALQHRVLQIDNEIMADADERPEFPSEITASDRDKDWILAIGHALGLDSGFKVPIVPEVEPFQRLFAELRDSAVDRRNEDDNRHNMVGRLLDDRNDSAGNDQTFDPNNMPEPGEMTVKAVFVTDGEGQES